MEPSGIAGAFHISKNEAVQNGRFSNLKINENNLPTI